MTTFVSANIAKALLEEDPYYFDNHPDMISDNLDELKSFYIKQTDPTYNTMRVREIVDKIDLKAIAGQRIIPKIWDKTLHEISTELPEWVVKTKNYSKHGLQREKKICDYITECQSKHTKETKYTHPKHKNINTFDDEKSMCEYLSKFDKWHFEQEIEVCYSDNKLKLLGHPDILSDTVVGDVKTTIHWKETRLYAITQVCIYAAMMDINKICIVLPLQKACAFHEFEDVKKDLYYLKKLMYNILQFTPYHGINYFQSEYNIGSHQQKKFVVENGDVFKNNNIQIFLGSPMTPHLPKLDLSSKNKLSKVAKQNNLFCHGPYTVLLSGSQEYIVDSIVKTMKLATEIGMKGVVYHIGSGDEKTMLENLKQVEPHIDEKCPLLIETSCGEGNEILVDVKELCKFVKQLNKKKFKVCCDSCHMFAAGLRDPTEGVKHFEKEIPGSVMLTHYNNSWGKCGSRVDKHSIAGFIPFNVMDGLAKYCKEKDIPMVFE